MSVTLTLKTWPSLARSPFPLVPRVAAFSLFACDKVGFPLTPSLSPNDWLQN